VFLEVSRASQSAIRAVEKAGGSVVCKYYNDLALKDVVHARTDRVSASPVRKADICEAFLLDLTPVTSLTYVYSMVYQLAEQGVLGSSAPSIGTGFEDRPRRTSSH
jgi:hypothetical protein